MPETESLAPPRNAPSRSRSFGLVARAVRRWLGIADQRHDFDMLGMTLAEKDQIVDGQRTDLERHGVFVRQIAEQLNQTTRSAVGADDRLRWYETHVPSVRAARKGYDQALARERRRRERLVATHPELSEEGKKYVRSTGTLPPAPTGDTP